MWATPQRLFRGGTYPSGKVSVWQVDARGRVIWRPIRQLTEADVLRALR